MEDQEKPRRTRRQFTDELTDEERKALARERYKKWYHEKKRKESKLQENVVEDKQPKVLTEEEKIEERKRIQRENYKKWYNSKGKYSEEYLESQKIKSKRNYEKKKQMLHLYIEKYGPIQV